MDDVIILFMTKWVKGREELAMRTICAATEHINYDGELKWYIADQSSTTEHLNTLLEVLGEDVYKYHNIPEITPGKSWNQAIMEIYKHTPIYLRLEDDFEIQADMDITPYVALFEEKKRVGMVRLGLMPIGLDLYSVSDGKNIYMNVLKSRHYCFSGNPGLIHQRFHEAYGWYDEHCNPGETEVRLDNEVRNKEGPEIWWPLNLGKYGTYGAWAHTGQVKSYE